MKKYLQLLLLIPISYFGQNVGIGTATPTTILDVESTNQTIMLPVIENIDALPSTNSYADGAIAFDVSRNCMRAYIVGSWQKCFNTKAPRLMETPITDNIDVQPAADDATGGGTTFLELTDIVIDETSSIVTSINGYHKYDIIGTCSSFSGIINLENQNTGMLLKQNSFISEYNVQETTTPAYGALPINGLFIYEDIPPGTYKISFKGLQVNRPPCDGNNGFTTIQRMKIQAFIL